MIHLVHFGQPGPGWVSGWPIGDFDLREMQRVDIAGFCWIAFEIDKLPVQWEPFFLASFNRIKHPRTPRFARLLTSPAQHQALEDSEESSESESSSCWRTPDWQESHEKHRFTRVGMFLVATHANEIRVLRPLLVSSVGWCWLFCWLFGGHG